MAIRPILRLGDPRLREVAAPVTRFDDPALRDTIADMTETMAAQNGAGLAAPQIGVALRIVIFGIENNPRYPDAPPVPRTVLINPEIAPLEPAIEDGWEGCLSVPGMRGLVPRFARIRYRGVGASGEPIDREASGFHARVVQHECDHLDGVLYPDRIRNRRMFGFIEELQASGVLGGAPLPEE
jgi:peptide deformylase